MAITVSFALFSGWKWLWAALLAVICLVALLFVVSIVYFFYMKLTHTPGTLVFENLDKEQALPPKPGADS